MALKLRLGSSAGTGPLADGEVEGAEAGGLDEKIVLLPARMDVGWVARPAIEEGCGAVGATGKPLSFGDAVDAGGVCAWACCFPEALEITGST